MQSSLLFPSLRMSSLGQALVDSLEDHMQEVIYSYMYHLGAGIHRSAPLLPVEFRVPITPRRVAAAAAATTANYYPCELSPYNIVAFSLQGSVQHCCLLATVTKHRPALLPRVILAPIDLSCKQCKVGSIHPEQSSFVDYKTARYSLSFYSNRQKTINIML